MNTVLIPAWRRPEMLWHCLANIKRAEGADQLLYIFRFDHGHDPELHDVIKGFPFRHEVHVTPRTSYLLSKQSYSLLTGYRIAADRSDGLVFMIEEDVMVATDFFRWHLAAHEAQPDAFCSIAVANPNRDMRDHGAADEYYLGSGDYCSLGVCFRREALLEQVLPRATSRYFEQPVAHCAKEFRDAPFGQAFAEQDGLIRRIQWRLGPERPIVWPWTPRAYHAGLYGKNRGPGPSGSFAKRLAYVTEVIYSDDAMRTLARHPEWYKDSRPINLNAEPWITLRLKPLDSDSNPLGF